MEKIKGKIYFTNKEIKNIKQLYSKEYSSIEIGKKYGVSWRLILNKLKEWDIKIKKKNSYSERRKQNFINKIKEKQARGEEWGQGKKGTGRKFDLEKVNYEHWINEKSLREIGKELGCSEYPIRKAMKNGGIKIRIISQRTKRTKQKMSKLRKGKKLEEIYDKEIAERMRKQLKENRSNQIFPLKDSSIEVKIQNFLKQLGIEFFTHQYMKIEHGYQCDILVPYLTLVIECDGDYWHKYPIGRDIDHIRTKELLGQGFKVLRLWEHEIKNLDLETFKKRLTTNEKQKYHRF